MTLTAIIIYVISDVYYTNKTIIVNVKNIFHMGEYSLKMAYSFEIANNNHK